MPRKALRCVVELTAHAVTCPGVWLPRRDDVYLSICLLGQTRTTQLTTPVFPLLFHERFRFDKVFYTAFEPSQVADQLDGMTVLIELIQLSDLYESGRLLARYQSSAKDFLYPYLSYSSSYSTQDRDVLLDRSLDFPGIAPKFEFATKTTIQETTASVIDDYDSMACDYDAPLYTPRPPSFSSRYSPRLKSRTFTGEKRRGRYQDATIASISRARSVSPSLRLQLEGLSLEDEDYYDEDEKPPFVVRRVDKKLIGRIPTPPSPGRSCLHGTYRSKSPRRSRTPGAYTPRRYNDNIYYDYNGRPHYRLGEKSYDSSYSRYNRSYTDDDLADFEVQGLSLPRSQYGGSHRYMQSITPRKSYVPSPPPTSTLRDRFDERPWSPTQADLISSRVGGSLRRYRSLERLNRTPLSYGKTKPKSTRFSRGLSDSLDDLAVDFEKARYGTYSPPSL